MSKKNLVKCSVCRCFDHTTFDRPYIRGQLQNELRPVAQGVLRPVGAHSATAIRYSSTRDAPAGGRIL